MIKMGKICYIIVLRERENYKRKLNNVNNIIVRKYRRLFHQRNVDVKTINEKF